MLWGVYEMALAAGILSSAAVDRLASTQNTRALSWIWLLEDAFANPILGSGFRETRANENSFLLAFAAYGVFCGTRSWPSSSSASGRCSSSGAIAGFVPARYRQIVHLILGFNAAYFAGAVFEWHIVSRLEANIAYMLVFSVMTRQLMEKVDAETSTQLLYADDLEDNGNAYGPTPDLEEAASA